MWIASNNPVSANQGHTFPEFATEIEGDTGFGAATFWGGANNGQSDGHGFDLCFIVGFVPTVASAKDTRFWNLTANTITSLQLSPAGKNEWGRNQSDNDKDRTVDHDERLKITDTPSGAYDVKIVDKTGRTCVVPNIQVKAGSIFSIDEKNLKDCTK